MANIDTSPSPPRPIRNHEVGNGGTLSKDALYAPLATYADCSSLSNLHHATTRTNTNVLGTAKKHSLSLQSKSTVSSLITSLTTIGQKLKTSHPYEEQLYRNIGGSIGRFGTGDGGRAELSLRGILEGQLSHRNLVLVGGSVYRPSAPDPTSLENSDEMSIAGLGIAKVALGSSKRTRKRIGGNGLFGSISNKRRKRILQHVAVEAKSRLEMQIANAEHALTNGEQPQNSRLETDISQSDLGGTKLHETLGAIIGTLHKMWIHYFLQLLQVGTTSISSSSCLSLDNRKQMSTMLATAEHVGMPATIVECPSRRHLADVRCVVVNETKATWKIAMMSRTGSHKVKPKERGNIPENSAHGKATKVETSMTLLWKIVAVPKRGTILEVRLPQVESSFSRDYITIRLEPEAC